MDKLGLSTLDYSRENPVICSSPVEKDVDAVVILGRLSLDQLDVLEAVSPLPF